MFSDLGIKSGNKVSVLLYQGSNNVIAEKIFDYLRRKIKNNETICLDNSNWEIIPSNDCEMQYENPDFMGVNLLHTIEYKVILRGILNERKGE